MITNVLPPFLWFTVYNIVHIASLTLRDSSLSVIQVQNLSAVINFDQQHFDSRSLFLVRSYIPLSSQNNILLSVLKLFSNPFSSAYTLQSGRRFYISKQIACYNDHVMTESQTRDSLSGAASVIKQPNLVPV